MSFSFRPLSLLLLVAASLSCLPSTAQRLTPKAADSAGAATAVELPVTRVALYKNGVGFFEHSGRVTGSQPVSINFTTAQLNDVLQSLTAIDLDGGRIAGADYNSTVPLEQQLKALPLGLGEEATSVDLYNSIRGARIEVRSAAASIAGRLLKMEVLENGTEEIRLITVVSDAGEIRTLPLTPATSVHLLDSDLYRDITRYLQLLAGTRNPGLRHFTLQDNAPAAGGAASRELMVSYISEVPVWKSTYRVLFSNNRSATQPVTLQGWSVVDNTTGEDWTNVRLSLIAGTPQSFIQPISQPIYSRRPEIPIAQSAQLTPQTHESGDLAVMAVAGIRGRVVDQTGAAIANALVIATNTATGMRVSRASDGQGNFTISSLQPGTYNVEVTSPGFQRLLQENVRVTGLQMAALNITLQVGAASETVTVTAAPPMLNTESAALAGTMENGYSALRRKTLSADNLGSVQYEMAAAASLTPNSSTSSFDDYFAYNLTEPITIRKNESALVPILQAKIDSELVTLWSPQQPVPLRALWMTNTSSFTLDGGSFSVVEDGHFGGEGLLETIHPKEKRLLSYAVDQAVRVSTEGAADASHAVSISAAKGVVVLRSSQTAEVTYVVHNAAPDARTVVIEHPVRPGYVLDAGLIPAETTPEAERFRVAAPAGETVRLRVAETFPGEAKFELTDSDDDDLALILKETGQRPEIAAALAPLLAARRQVADAEEAVKAINARLEGLRSDEERERSNVTALAAADKTSRDRFVRDLNATEDRIAAAQKELATVRAVQKSAEDNLDAKIEAVQLDEKL